MHTPSFTLYNIASIVVNDQPIVTICLHLHKLLYSDNGFGNNLDLISNYSYRIGMYSMQFA